MTGPAVGLAAVLYLLPSFLAVVKRRRNLGTIFGVNILLGWTVAGWIVAWLWAIGGTQGIGALFGRHVSTRRACPSCGRSLRKTAHRCRACGYTLAEGQGS